VISRLDKPTPTYRDNPGPVPGRRPRVFQDDAVRFFGQPVAVVVATTLEAAQHAADLVEVSYDVEQLSTDLTRIRGRSWKSVRRAEATERHNLSDPGAGREGPGTGVGGLSRQRRVRVDGAPADW
jgi:CO/xanthine dehydrogenase Mo-binding subunit